MSQSFKDAAGRTWLVQIDGPLMKRVRLLTGVEINKFTAKGFDPLWEVIQDPVALIDVLYALCKDEADRLGLTDEQFGRGLVADNLDAARDAFVMAYADFSPSQTRRVIVSLVTKHKAITSAAAEKAVADLERIDPGVPASTLSGSASPSPAPSASAPPA